MECASAMSASASCFSDKKQNGLTINKLTNIQRKAHTDTNRG